MSPRVHRPRRRFNLLKVRGRRQPNLVASARATRCRARRALPALRRGDGVAARDVAVSKLPVQDRLLRGRDGRVQRMSSLPSGTVTFLFSDIEGSTRLTRELRDGWGAVLADHRSLLREAFGEHGGREVDMQGDAFFFAFPRARDAVEAAVAG